MKKILIKIMCVFKGFDKKESKMILLNPVSLIIFFILLPFAIVVSLFTNENLVEMIKYNCKLI